MNRKTLADTLSSLHAQYDDARDRIEQAREELAAQYEAEVADGVNAAVEGLVDDVIDPADSRKMVIAALEILSSKRDSNPPKKHGNMPL